MSGSSTAAVLIVGAGPTGLTAALELTRFGIPVRLIDKAAAPSTTSRAAGVQARTVELLHLRDGLGDELVRLGNCAVAGSIYEGGKRSFRLEFAHIDSPYPFLLFVPQSETERVLRERLAALGVQVEREVELIAFSSWGHGSSAEVTTVLRLADGRLEAFHPSYVIAAEGAHSLSRSTLGIEFEGHARGESYLLADVSVDADGLAESDFHVFSSLHGFMGMFPLGNRLFRIIAANPLTTSGPGLHEPPTLSEAQQMYDQRSHIPAVFRDQTWSSWFHINSRMVDRLQQGRLFLGGDSAHIHSPAGAQGMNTGIQDMVNLCWKLAFTIKGHASPALLSMYSEGRVPIIRGVVHNTDELTSVIGSRSASFRSVFSHIAPLVASTGFVQTNSTTRMSQIGLNYRHSVLSESAGRPGDLHAGDRVPDMQVQLLDRDSTQPARSVRLWSLLDISRLTLLYVRPDEPGALHAEVQSKLGQWRELITSCWIAAPGELTPAEHKRFVAAFGPGALLVLVLPDSYIGFLASGQRVDELHSYLRKWFTALPEDKNSDGQVTHSTASSLVANVTQAMLQPRVLGSGRIINGSMPYAAAGPTATAAIPRPNLTDHTNCQVLMVDLQPAIVARSKTTAPAALASSAGVLAQMAKLFQVPVVLSVVPEGEQAPQLIPELATELGDLPLYLRANAQVLLDPATRAALASNRRRVVVLVGFALEAVVVLTARALVEAGYAVVVAVDGCGGMSARTEEAALKDIEAAGGVLTSVVSLAVGWAPDFTTAQGKQMFAIVQQLRLA